MEKFKGKKGLSKSKNILLITMLILISSAIIWIVLKEPINKTAEQIAFYEYELDLKIRSVSLDENSMNITVVRNPGRGNFIGTSFKIEGNNLSETFIERSPLRELEMKTYQLDMISLNSPDAVKIQIAPIFKLESGEEMVGEVKDEYRFSWSR